MAGTVQRRNSTRIRRTNTDTQTILRKDGTVFAAEIALAPLPSKNAVHLVSTIRKTGSTNASEAFFRNLLDAAPDAMVIVDAHGKIAIVNAQTEQRICSRLRSSWPRSQCKIGNKCLLMLATSYSPGSDLQ